MYVHTAQLGTAMQLRKHFSGIEQALGIECAFEPLLLGEIGFREHCGHEIPLFDSHAVLAGENAPHLDA